MNPKLCMYVLCLLCLGNISLTYTMENSTSSSATSGSDEPFPLLQLPADVIENIGSFLDLHNLAVLSQCCQRLNRILSPNPFCRLPPLTLQKIIKMCTQRDLIRLWQVSKFFYAFFINPEKPFVIECTNYYPYFFDQSSPSRTMIEYISKLVNTNKQRGIPVSLDLSGQLDRPGMREKIDFIDRLFRKLDRLKITGSIVELNLANNFDDNFLISLVHYNNPIPLSNHEATCAINRACISATNVATLILNSNSLVEIPDQIIHLRKLKILRLAWNYLRPQSLAVCRALTSLTELDLSRNRLNAVPYYVRLLPNLRLLDVSKNPLDDEARRLLLHNVNTQLTVLFDKD